MPAMAVCGASWKPSVTATQRRLYSAFPFAVPMTGSGRKQRVAVVGRIGAIDPEQPVGHRQRSHPIPPGRSGALNLRPAVFRPKHLDPRSCRIQSTKRLVVSLRLGHRCGRRRFVALPGSGERNKRIVEFLAGGLQFQQQFAPRFFWGWHLQDISKPQFRRCPIALSSHRNRGRSA